MDKQDKTPSKEEGTLHELPPLEKPAYPSKSKWTGWVLVVISAITASLLLFFVIGYFTPPDLELPTINGGRISIKPPRFPGRPTEKIILVMGVDSNYNGTTGEKSFKGTRTDSMMLVRVNPSRQAASVVSIPRDSKVFIGKHRRWVDKINAAYAHGGGDLAVETVESSFGIPVDNYVVINAQGIRELVDAIGGVKIYVEKPMKYRDRTAKLDIDFEPGHHVLNGKQAEGYLRFRHDELGDIGRVRRQQNFLSAVAVKFRNPFILTKLDSLISLASKYVETDLRPDEMARLAWFGKELDMGRVRTATMPGHPSSYGISYWVIDSEAAQTVLDRLILDNPGSVEAITDGNPLKVGILYGPSGKAQLEELVTKLERKKFRVICKSGQKNRLTQIIEHTGRVNDDWTDRLRKTDALLSNARLIFAPVGTTFEMNACSLAEDYTIIIGEDIRSKAQ